MKILILLPARYASSRFPGKPLVKLKGKSLIHHCFDNLKQLSQWHDCEVAVVTDSDEIENHLKSVQARCVRVDDETNSGSERIYLAYERYFKNENYDFIVNVQGDEPLLLAKDVKELIDFQVKSNYEIATIGTIQRDFKLFENPNCVKVALGENGRAIYFSRSPIPHRRDESLCEWILHAGVYSYTKDALEKFNSLEVSKLENLEKLEQLRALENNISIGVMCLDKVLLGVDIPKDIEIVKGHL